MKALVRRRDLFKTGALTAAAAGLAGGKALASNEYPQEQQSQIVSGAGYVNGRLRRVLGSVAEIETTDGLRRVSFLPDATFSRDGVVTLESFRIGDPVFVRLTDAAQQADSANAIYPARRMEIRYGRLSGVVTALNGDVLETSSGPLRLAPDTVIHVVGNRNQLLTRSALGIGVPLLVLTRADPVSGERLARLIGVQPT